MRLYWSQFRALALQWNTKFQLNLNLAAPYNVHVVYQTQETVFHRDIPTPRGELKKPTRS